MCIQNLKYLCKFASNKVNIGSLKIPIYIYKYLLLKIVKKVDFDNLNNNIDN